MAGEVMLINPRRKHRRKKARRARRARTHHRRRRGLFAANPRRRHRRARGRRVRRHRNPRAMRFFGVDLGAVGLATSGYFVTRYATGGLLGMLPAEWRADPNTAPLVRIGMKAAVGVGLPMMLRPMIGRSVSNWLAVGGGIAVLADLFETYVAQMIPLPLADYEQGMLTDYEQGQLTGLGQEESAGDVYAGSIYG